MALPGVPIVWSGLFLTSGGFQDECRGFVLGLDDAGVEARPNPLDWYGYVRPQPGSIIERIDRLLLVESPDEPFVHDVHEQPSWQTYQRHSKAVLTVGRTMFETSDGIELWLANLLPEPRVVGVEGVDLSRGRVEMSCW